jgi:hypothetical protein
MSENIAPLIVIQGLTLSGKPFRPSDWADRLAGVFTCLGNDHRLCYSPYVRPITIDNIRCVEVLPALKEIDPMAFSFLMNFARDNELTVLEQAGEQAA